MHELEDTLKNYMSMIIYIPDMTITENVELSCVSLNNVIDVELCFSFLQFHINGILPLAFCFCWTQRWICKEKFAIKIERKVKMLNEQ